LELKTKSKQWTSLERSQFKIELPPNTLLLAERVQEQFSDVNIKYSFSILEKLKAFLGTK
jgi:hypothetical protein